MKSSLLQVVPFKEVLIPFLMMWVLSLIHSQIVATSPITEKPKTKMKPFRRKRCHSKRKQKLVNKTEVVDLKLW